MSTTGRFQDGVLDCLYGYEDGEGNVTEGPLYKLGHKEACKVTDQIWDIYAMTVGKDQLVEMLLEMKKHTEDNPTHGRGCACKDKYTVGIKNLIGELGLYEEFLVLAGRMDRRDFM